MQIILELYNSNKCIENKIIHSSQNTPSTTPTPTPSPIPKFHKNKSTSFTTTSTNMTIHTFLQF